MWCVDLRTRSQEAIACIEQGIRDRQVPPGRLTLGSDNGSQFSGVSNSGRNFVRQLSEHFLSGGQATWMIGRSSNSADRQTPYFSLYASGPQRVGAAAYVYPVNGRVTARLAWDDPAVSDELRAQAFRASEKDGSMYAVGVMVTSQPTYDAAVQLVTLAIDRARQA